LKKSIKKSAKIVHDNALRIDWETVLKKVDFFTSHNGFLSQRHKDAKEMQGDKKPLDFILSNPKNGSHLYRNNLQ
jgi:hypothetical protein